jgi:hypothetical protein
MNLKKILNGTVYTSLFVQILTAIIDIYVLQKPVSPEFSILKNLLKIEILVQFVEGTFYLHFANNINTITNVTPTRYYDWVITTPTMLYALCIYLDFINYKSNAKHKKEDTHDEENQESSEKKPLYTMTMSFERNLQNLSWIILLNWAMLLFGYLGEIGILTNTIAVVLGFFPFVAYFTIIYQEYAKYTIAGQILFWSFSGIWAFYGIAALFTYYWKNIVFNILDIFSKNFFGLFLAYVVYEQYKITV